MAVEPKRGCGYRKIGGTYLVGDPGGFPCDRLPIILTSCPVCGNGFKQARGFTWIDVDKLVGGIHRNCQDEFPCPLCMDTSKLGKAGLLWIGEQFYRTPKAFDDEARILGISRRIAAVPRNFKVGETWVLLAHPKTTNCKECCGNGFVGQGIDGPEPPIKCETCHGTGKIAAIFKVWRPKRVEKILPESARGSQEAKDLVERGITPVFMPDDDPDHRGSVYEDDSNEVPEEVKAA